MEPKITVRHLHLFRKFGLFLAFDIDQVKIYRLNGLAFELLDLAAGDGQTQEQLEAFLVHSYALEDIRRVFSSLLKTQLLSFDNISTSLEKLEKPAEISRFQAAQIAQIGTGLNKIILAVTDQCNLACKYCLSKPGSCAPHHHMSPATAHAAVDFLLARMGDYSTANIVFYGGEPLLNFQCIRETIPYALHKAAAQSKIVTFSLITNGTLLTAGISDFLIEHQVAIGLSLDGDSLIHDANRVFSTGRGSHDLVIKHYRELMQKGADVTPQAVLSSAGQDILGVVDSLHDQGILNYKLIPGMRPDGEVELIAADGIDYCNQYSRMVERKLREGHGTPVKLPIDLFSILDRIERGLKIKSSCSASLNQVAFSPAGDIFPCDNFLYQPGFHMGNVHTEFKNDLQKIFKNIGISSIEECRECWARHLCGGPCPYFSLKKHGRPDTTVKSFCIRSKNVTETALAVYTICKAQNKNFLADWLKKR